MKVEIKQILLRSVTDKFSVGQYPSSGFFHASYTDGGEFEDVIVFVDKPNGMTNYITSPTFLYRTLDHLEKQEVKKSETEPKKAEITESFTLELVRLLTREKDAKN